MRLRLRKWPTGPASGFCIAGRLAAWTVLERKNGWQLAEQAGDATPDGVSLCYRCGHLVRDDRTGARWAPPVFLGTAVAHAQISGQRTLRLDGHRNPPAQASAAAPRRWAMRSSSAVYADVSQSGRKRAPAKSADVTIGGTIWRAYGPDGRLHLEEKDFYIP